MIIKGKTYWTDRDRIESLKTVLKDCDLPVKETNKIIGIVLKHLRNTIPVNK